MEYRWIPGQQLDSAAIARMKAHFPRPATDPPEAWFMSHPQVYHSGLLEALIAVPPNVRDVEHFLEDVGRGIKIFGRRQEWVEWFHFLLPYLLEVIFEHELLPLSMNYLINLYPQEIVDEYPEFRQDIFSTLIRCVMAEHLWQTGDLAAQYRWFDDRAGYWSPAFCASMMFCLKYLTVDEIATWMESIASIRGERWTRDLITWLHGLKQAEYFTTHPQEMPAPKDEVEARWTHLMRLLKATGIDWDGSYVIFSNSEVFVTLDDFLPKEKRDALWAEIQKYPHLLIAP